MDPQIKHAKSAYEKCEYENLGSWYIKSSLYNRLLYLKLKFQKN